MTAPYTRNEVASVIDACAAIEIVHSRFAQKAPVSNLEKLANSISNGALVHDVPRSDWHDLQLGKLKVMLSVNGKKQIEQVGGHPTGDPLGVAVVLANLWREKGGVRTGQFVTCGSFTGLKFLKPGDVCSVRFRGAGFRRGDIHESVTGVGVWSRRLANARGQPSASARSSKARSAKARMLATRSSLPVSSVMTFETPGPVTEMQVWPDLSPYRLPAGPVAPVSPSPQVALSRVLTVLASSKA